MNNFEVFIYKDYFYVIIEIENNKGGEKMEEYNGGNMSEENEVVSLWKFVGIMALSMIPCVGLICTIVFACGAIKNKNIINFARAQLIIAGIIMVIYILLIVLGVMGGIASSAQRTIMNAY